MISRVSLSPSTRQPRRRQAATIAFHSNCVNFKRSAAMGCSKKQTIWFDMAATT